MLDLKFKTREALWRHFKKHGPKTGATSPEDYLELANKVRAIGNVAPAKRGKIRISDPRSKKHIIIDPEINKLLTFYVRRALMRDLV